MDRFIEFSSEHTRRLQINREGIDINTTLRDNTTQNLIYEQHRRTTMSRGYKRAFPSKQSANNDLLAKELSLKIKELNSIVNAHKQQQISRVDNKILTAAEPSNEAEHSREVTNNQHTTETTLMPTKKPSEVELPKRKRKISKKSKSPGQVTNQEHEASAEGFMSLQPKENVHLLNPKEEPPFFSIFVE